MADMAEANRNYFDSKAREYDTKPWQQKMIAYIVAQVEEQREFFGFPPVGEARKGEFRLLDYACGPGTMSKAMSFYTTSTQGIDISDNMVATYNERASTALLATQCSAVKGNLLADEPYIFNAAGEKDADAVSKPEYNDFDTCIVGLGFHHFDKYAASLEYLARHVKKGGVVGIVDLFGEKAHDDALTHEMKAAMHKSGFTEEEMRGYMSEAGLVDVDFVELSEPVVMQIHEKDIARRVFFARGRKPDVEGIKL